MADAETESGSFVIDEKILDDNSFHQIIGIVSTLSACALEEEKDRMARLYQELSINYGSTRDRIEALINLICPTKLP